MVKPELKPFSSSLKRYFLNQSEAKTEVTNQLQKPQPSKITKMLPHESDDCYYNQDYEPNQEDLSSPFGTSLHSHNLVTILFYVRMSEHKEDAVVKMLKSSLHYIFRR